MNSHDENNTRSPPSYPHNRTRVPKNMVLILKRVPECKPTSFLIRQWGTHNLSVIFWTGLNLWCGFWIRIIFFWAITFWTSRWLVCRQMTWNAGHQSALVALASSRWWDGLSGLCACSRRQPWGAVVCDATLRQNDSALTHWGRDKMAAISHTTHSYAFSWMKMYEFFLQFHWSLFRRVQLTIVQHLFR